MAMAQKSQIHLKLFQTKCLIFIPMNKQDPLKINYFPIFQVLEWKLLGEWVNEQFSWTAHGTKRRIDLSKSVDITRHPSVFRKCYFTHCSTWNFVIKLFSSRQQWRIEMDYILVRKGCGVFGKTVVVKWTNL